MLKEKHIYIINFDGDKFVDKLIKFWTRGIFSHSAVLFPDWTFLEIYPPRQTRWKYTTIVTNHQKSDLITVFDINTEDSYDDIKKMYDTLIVGKKYDWIGIIGFVLRLKKGQRNGYFCSEGSIIPLYLYYHWTRINPEYVSPEHLVELLSVNYEKSKEIFSGTIEQFMIQFGGQKYGS